MMNWACLVAEVCNTTLLVYAPLLVLDQIAPDATSACVTLILFIVLFHTFGKLGLLRANSEVSTMALLGICTGSLLQAVLVIYVLLDISPSIWTGFLVLFALAAFRRLMLWMLERRGLDSLAKP